MFAFSRRYAPPATFAVAALVAWVVAVFNMLVHTHDAWTSVVPWGVTLSAVTVLVLAVAYVIGAMRPAVRCPRPHPRKAPDDPYCERRLDLALAAAVLAVGALGAARAEPGGAGRAESRSCRSRSNICFRRCIWRRSSAGSRARRRRSPPGSRSRPSRPASASTRATLYTLPNGDVLVVESQSPGVQPIRRPKDIVMALIEILGDRRRRHRQEQPHHAAARRPRATASRTTRIVFLDNLTSPFGVALVGGDLYVANTDSLDALSLQGRRHARSSRPASRCWRCRAGRSTTIGPRASSPARTARCSMSASAPTATSSKTAWRRRRTAPRSGRSTARPGAGASSPAACATRTA